MKKLLLALAILFTSTGIFAQTPVKTMAHPDSSKKAAAAPKPAASAGPAKKDGTADMRYKTNKESAKPVPAGPVKKDGSADMRYKANKPVKDSAKKKN